MISIFSTSSNRTDALAGMASARSRAIVALVLLAAILVCGGSSRGDVLLLIVLRPLAILAAAYAIWAMPAGAARPLWPLIGVLAAAIAASAIHLVPLPPRVWEGLPERELIARFDELLGRSSQWRPLALSPAEAWNTLFSMFVPLSAVLVFASLTPAHRAYLPAVWAFTAMASAAWGLMQLLAGGSGALYTYAVTNEGSPVGLFANANHNAIFLAASMPVVALWSRRKLRHFGQAALVTGAVIGLFGFVIVLTGSRSGVVLGLVSAIVSSAALIDGFRARSGGRPDTAVPAWLLDRRLHIALALLVVALVTAAIWVDWRQMLGFSVDEPIEEVRFAVLPSLLDMARTHLVFGVGAGAFEPAYRISEPTALLNQYYLNEAHNDWLQVGIEFGIAGWLWLCAVVGGLILIARSVLKLGGHSLATRLSLLLPLVIYAAASMFDYPLRTAVGYSLVAAWVASLTYPDWIRDQLQPRERAGRQRGV